MNYFSSLKDWKYHAKSALVTFLAVFMPIMAMEVSKFDLANFDPQGLTIAIVWGALVALARLAVYSAARALVVLFVLASNKFKK